MKRESIVLGVAGLALGFMLGLITPRLFGGGKNIVDAPGPQPEQEFAQTGLPSPEQLENQAKEYKEILKNDPKNKTALLELGGVYYGARRFPEAVECYKQAVAVDDKELDAYVMLGNIYYDTNNPPQAIEYYQKALAIKPELSDVRVDMSTMYRVNKEPDKAVEELRYVNQNAPTHSTAFLNLGIILKNDKNDPAGAKEAWQNFLKVVPTGPQAEQIKQMIAELDKPAQATKN